MSLIFCPECGTQVSEHAMACTKCGYPISKIKSVHSNGNQATNNYYVKPAESVNSVRGLIVTGYVLACVSIVFIPLLFGLAGLIVGIVNISKGHAVHGVAHIVLSICFGILGTFFGALSELL